MNPYEVLGLKRGASLEEIRQRYKHLAKLNHPDRLHNVSDAEKKEKEEFFKRVTVAYHIAMESAEPSGREDTSGAETGAWGGWGEVLFHTFADVANKYMQRKEHRLRVPVDIADVYLRRHKKLQVFLKGVEAPVMLTIACHKERIVTDIIVEDGSVHKVVLDLVVQEHPIYFFGEDGDVVANVDVTWGEYVRGKRVEVKFLDGTDVEIEIPPFPNLDEWAQHPSGKFKVCLRVVCPERGWWDHIDEENRKLILKLLENQRT